MTVPTDTDQTDFIAFPDLVALLSHVFMRHGTSPEVAGILGRNCAVAERDGATSHGVFRIRGYITTLHSGWVDGRAKPVLEPASGSVLRVDAANGFAQPALAAALPWAHQAAQNYGIALVAIRRSHHFGALWADVEPLAEAGFLALTFANTISRVVPHGARQPVYGTNPMAFAVPRTGGGTLTFDQASSTVAMGEVRVAARDGRALPLGLGVDKNGKPTTDPATILDGGALLPFGGHKGSAIAMMVEIMAAALTGADYSFEVDRTGFSGAETSRAGQTLILIDPTKSAGRGFATRIERLVDQLRTAGQDRLPGERRHARRRSVAEGIPLRRAILDDLRNLARAADDS